MFLSSSLTPQQSDTLPANYSKLTNSTLPLSAPATPSFGSASGPVTIDLTLDDSSDGEDKKESPLPISEELLIYRNIITAVLSVVTFNLASSEGFTPLNIRTLVSPSSLPITEGFKSQAERDGKEEVLPSRPITSPELVTPLVLELQAYMTSLGSLFIIPHSEKQRAIRRIGTCGLTPASLHLREVFIAPWGEWGRILPPSENSANKKAEERWKENVVSYLKDRGIVSHTPIADSRKSILQEAIEQGKWLNVEIWLRSLTDPSMGDLHRVLWPEALLFLRTSEGDKRTAVASKERENPDFWKLVFDDPEYSQLAWGKLASLMTTLDRGNPADRTRELDSGAEWWNVESAVKWGHRWYMGREERAAKMRQKLEEGKQKEMAEARLRETGHLGESFDKPKGRLGIENKPGPGGVYPTPPDAAGAPPTGGPSSTADITAAFTAGGVNAMDHDWMGDGAALTDNALTTQQPMGSRETDLFGESMEEMDLLIKVTDDDFDFFDHDPDFGDANGGGMDLDVMMGDVPDMSAQPVDLRMSSPPPPQNIRPHASTNPPTRQSEPRTKKRMRERPAPAEIKPPRVVPENQVQTPPLSPHRAITLLVPGYSAPYTNSVNPTPPASGGFKKPAMTATAVAKSAILPLTLKKRSSMYSPIAFTENVEMADQKYAPGGRFFLPETIKEVVPTEEDATKIGKFQTLKRKRTGFSTTTATPATGYISVDDEDSMEYSSESESDRYSDESDADDTTEDEDSRYHTSPDRTSVLKQFGFPSWPAKRRKWSLEGGDTDADSPERFSQRRDVAIGADGEVQIAPDVAPPPWKTMMPDPLEQTLVGVFEDMTLTSDAMTLGLMTETNFLDVAAALAEQRAGWVHSSWQGKNETTADDEEDEETCLIRRRCGRDQSLVEDAVRSVFREGTVVRCNLETYAAIADSIQDPPPIPPPPPLGHLNRGNQALKPNISQRRNKEVEQNKGWDIFNLPPPHVRLTRGDNVLEILPPALHFWETFSLAPISGSKNVISICFHPASSALEEGAEFLLDRISSSYEAGRFGVHVRAEIEGVVKNGLVAVELPDGSPRNYEYGMEALLAHLKDFGTIIANSIADEGMNVVIYVVNPFDHPSALVDICTGFIRLQRSYETAIALLPDVKPNHLVLQIIPANFIAHKLGGVMRVEIVHRLAVEVYSRCIPTDAGIDYAEAKRVASPPIQLARPIPKNIEFLLTPDPSPALLKENQLLHIAYSQSTDERWVAVAWSDNTGAVQKTSIINLGRRNTSVLRPFNEIMNEIWDTTTELIKYPAVKWRLCITKLDSAATMPEDEASTWTALIATHERVSAAYLVSADLASPFRVFENLPDLKMENFWPQANLYLTPPVAVNTPTPTNSSIVSPDASASTPGGSESAAELDADAELVDANDECWGVVLGHTLPRGEEAGRRNSPTGLLLRKDGGTEGGGWSVVVCFSVLGENVGQEVVREVLEAWRGLGVLGGGRKGVPWILGWCRGVEEVSRVM